MIIKNLEDAKKIFANKDSFILGIGVRAYPRISPMYFINKNIFNILYWNKSNDNELISELTNLLSLKEITNNEYGHVAGNNTINILQSKKLETFINKKNKQIYLYIYKNNNQIEQIAKNNHWQILYSNANLAKKYENKEYFKNLLKDLKIQSIDNENLKFNDFIKKDYFYFQRKFGNKIVCQIANYIDGGGLGTVFINSEREFEQFKLKINNKKYNDIDVEVLNVARYIEGLPISMNGCVTKYGILHSSARTMIIDIPEVRNIKLGNGLFCGHDWGYYSFSQNELDQMNQTIEKIGENFAKDGYKGIFGIDFLLDEKTKKIYPIECNPRYTGNFPVESLPLLENNHLSLDVFHLLEHMQIDYKIDIEHVNKIIQHTSNLSHIFLTNIHDKEFTIKSDLKAGVYKLENNQLIFTKDSLQLKDIGENEFMIVENMMKGEKVAASSDPSRFMRLIFADSILKDKNNLTKKAKEIIKHIYNIIYK